MAEKKLGRGLDFLISEDPSIPGDEVLDLDLEVIAPNPHQPRKEFDPAALKELADSIRQDGVLQPIIVRQTSKGYEIIAGERRWRASREAGLETIPALVRSVDDSKMLELALIENVQREDLNSIEKAKACKRMMEQLSLTQEQVAQKLGKDRSSVANLIRLLELPSEVQDCVTRGSLSMGHARALVTLRDGKAQVELCKRIVRDALTVRDVEREVARRTGSEGSVSVRSADSPPSKSAVPEAQIKDLEDQIRKALGMRVRIRQGAKRGRVVIDYANPHDFEKLFVRLVGSKPRG